MCSFEMYAFQQNEQDFMDNFLTDAADLVSEWSSPVKYSTLNAAEKCLLLAGEKAEKAQLLAKDMRNAYYGMVSKHRRYCFSALALSHGLGWKLICFAT